MELKEVKVLLQKFYDGLSTAEEELQLISYFKGQDVPDELQADRELFLSMDGLKEESIEIPEDLKYSVMTSLEPLQKTARVRRLSNTRIYSMISVAASVLIIVSALMFLNQKPDLGSYDDPEMAYAETKEALEMVSKYFNKGTEHISTLEKIETPQRSLEYLKSFDQGLEQTRGIIEIGNK